MPYQYALHERIADAKDPSMQEIYHPASQEEAEQYPDGRFRLLNNDGKPVTDWYYMHGHPKERDDYGKGKPLSDCLGQTLAAHDYVTASKAGHTQHHLAEVINFTPKKIRIRYLAGFEALKSPDEVTKVDRALFH